MTEHMNNYGYAEDFKRDKTEGDVYRIALI